MKLFCSTLILVLGLPFAQWVQAAPDDVTAAHAWERLRAYLSRTLDSPDPAGDHHEHH